MLRIGTQQPFGGQGALGQAVSWVEGILSGTLGTSIAVLGIAGVGFAMLNGRISARCGVRAVLGCFVLFGASAIAHALTEFSGSRAIVPEIPSPKLQQEATIPTQLPASNANPFDPYAGASVPMR